MPVQFQFTPESMQLLSDDEVQNVAAISQAENARRIARRTAAPYVEKLKEVYTILMEVDTDAMSAFMGLFSAATGVIAAIMQLAFTGRILERFGVVFSLLLLPLTLVLGLCSALGGLLQAFYAAVFTKGAENSFRYSIHDATMQILYIPVPSSVRGRAKTFIDGIVKPLAGGIAGALMVLLVGPLHVPVTSFGIVALALVLFWVSLIFRMRGEYVKELLATLRKRKLDFSEKRLVIDDAASVKFLRDRLSSPNEAEVGNALELCRKVRQHDLSAELSRLLTHPSAELRISALEILSERSMILGESQTAVDIDLVEACFNDENNDVCAAAIRTFCSLMGEPAVATIEPFLKSTAPAVRAAAVASIIRHGGLEGIVQAAEDLKAMLLSEDENVRFYCARVLQEVEIHRFYSPAQKLLADESPRVRSAAIAAAGAMLSPELVPTLIYKLRHRSTRRAAQLALAQYGEAVIETLARVLGQRMEDAVLRRQVPRILERIGTRRALDALVHSLDADDGETRNEAARSTSRLRERLGSCQDLAVFEAMMAPHQVLAPWRSRLAPLTADRRMAHLKVSAKLASRLFAEKPRAFRSRIGALWEAQEATDEE